MKTMTTLQLRSAMPTIKNISLLLALCLAPLALLYLGSWLQEMQPTLGVLEAGIWQLLFLSLLCFIGFTALAWWLLQRAWTNLGLPKIQTMVSQFKNLTSCQQFAFYWASFALLLLAAVLSLVAVF
jgi:hypothetical protein